MAELIRVLSYNIHHGEGMDGRVDLARLAGVIDSVAPDLVSLQEVDRGMARTGGVDQLGELARLTGMAGIFGCAIDRGGDGQYGNAVLSRFPVKTLGNHPLPGEPRAALTVEVAIPPSPLLFIATHLDTESEPRLASVPLLAEALAAHAGKPALLAGDFNATPQSETLSALGRDWADATAGRDLATFSAKQIDYILLRPPERWRIAGTGALDERVASDHLPLWADLELLPARP